MSAHSMDSREMCIHFVECKLVDWLFLSFWEGMAIPVHAIPKELCMLCCEPLPVHRLHTHTHTAWWAHENGRNETLLGVCAWVISTDAEFGMHHVCTCVLAHAIIRMVMMIRREKPWEGQPNTFHGLRGSMHTLLYLTTVLDHYCSSEYLCRVPPTHNVLFNCTRVSALLVEMKDNEMSANRTPQCSPNFII